MSDKRKKFEEFAIRRTNKAISHIRLIGKLANRNAYEYTDEDVNKIVSALKKEIENIKNKFSTSKRQTEDDFSL
jgi:rubrerythrin